MKFCFIYTCKIISRIKNKKSHWNIPMALLIIHHLFTHYPIGEINPTLPGPAFTSAF